MKYSQSLRLLRTCMLLALVTASLVHAGPKMIVSFRRYPALEERLNIEKLHATLQNPQKMIRKVLRTYLPSYSVADIFASYGGYLGISDDTGSIIFPHRHQDAATNLLITLHAEPIIMLGKTVHHWEIPATSKTAMYRMTRSQDNETGLYVWTVAETDLPADRRIPLDTVIIFAKPKDVYMPIGVSITNKNPQLVLPEVYVRTSINSPPYALQLLSVKHFFRTLRPLDQKGETETYWQTQQLL